MTLNQVIYELITTAPVTEISHEVMQKVVAYEGSSNEKLIELFEWMVNQPDEQCSSFVKRVVDPKYTKSPGYAVEIPNL